MKIPPRTRVIMGCCAVASTVLVLGCYATVTPMPVGAVVTTDDYVVVEPPPRIETYPVVVYAGAPHYYVGGRWYWRSPRGWAYYRREPPELVGRRPGPPPPRGDDRRDRDDHHDDRHDDRHDEHR